MKKLTIVAMILSVLTLVCPCSGATAFTLTSTSGPIGYTLTLTNVNVLTNSWELQRSTNGEPFVGVSSTNTFSFGSVDNKSTGRIIPVSAFVPGFYRFVAVQSGTNVHVSNTNTLVTVQTTVGQGGITVSYAGPTMGAVLETSTNLTNWTFYSSNGPTVTNFGADTLVGLKKFYRVRIVVP